MSVRFAMLALLREKDDYGYRLKKRFDENVGQQWRLNLGQVYQTLHTLESRGLIARSNEVEEEVDVSGMSQARRRFSLTDKGKRTLERWLTRRPGSVQPVRDELLIHLLALEPSEHARAMERIQIQMGAYTQHLSRLVARKSRLVKEDSKASMLADLSVEAAIMHTEAHLHWLDYCRQRLESAPN